VPLATYPLFNVASLASSLCTCRLPRPASFAVVGANSVASASAARAALLMLTVDNASGIAALAAVVLLTLVVDAPAGTDAAETAVSAGDDASRLGRLMFI